MGISLSALISGLLTKVTRERKNKKLAITENGFLNEEEERIFKSIKATNKEKSSGKLTIFF
jgi:hypothetical protein